MPASPRSATILPGGNSRCSPNSTNFLMMVPIESSGTTTTPSSHLAEAMKTSTSTPATSQPMLLAMKLETVSISRRSLESACLLRCKQPSDRLVRKASGCWGLRRFGRGGGHGLGDVMHHPLRERDVDAHRVQRAQDREVHVGLDAAGAVLRVGDPEV